MKKIGIMGGTFDPPHIGHLIIADEVREQKKLDEIWFIPTNIPPHKKQANSSASDRVHMLQEMIGRNESFRVDPIEINRKDISYTLHTVRALKNMHVDKQFYFIIGADMVEYLPHWFEIDALLEEIIFIGVKRKGFDMHSPFPIEEVDIPLIDVSSSMIRDRVKKQRTFQYYVHHRVAHYIKEHQLYE